MCGIVGYIGDKFVDSVLLVGLERLEYRGYDSAGLATISDNELRIVKKKGKLKILNDAVVSNPLGGNIGIGHTRWATHGEPSEINAHPHLDCKKKIAVVHNGIIENYQILKDKLIQEGHIFVSETDTEVIPHLIEKYYDTDLETAVRKTLLELKGAYAICVISEKEPDKIVIAKSGSPLVIGIGKDENFVASDILALLPHTRNIIHLSDNQISVITKTSYRITDFYGKEIKKNIEKIKIEIVDSDKGDYEHFMLKEIYEQPQILENLLSKIIRNDSIVFDELNLDKKYLLKVKRIIIQACGTSWHAGLVAKFWLEKYARVYTEVDVSSEFRYRNPLLEGDTLMLAISQSGETADTIAGIHEGKSKFIKVLSVVNVTKSTIARESDGIIPIMAGPEIGVASTKAYTAELTALYLFSLYLGLLNYTIDDKTVTENLNELRKVPMLLRKLLHNKDIIIECAEKYHTYKDFMFISRGINYPTALEGALKLKEISYIHSTGYPAGEFKHGPIALVSKDMPVVCIVPKGEIYPKMVSNIEEVRSRNGRIITVATENDKLIENLSEFVIYVPECSEVISPIVTIVPLQLLAYHIAVKLGCDVDKPRNLAKSVTVE